jgi:hypothetical protein
MELASAPKCFHTANHLGQVELSLIKAPCAAALKPAGEVGASASNSASNNSSSSSISRSTSNSKSSDNPRSIPDVASSKLAEELLKAMGHFSPGTKQKFLDVLSSNVLAEPELPIAEAPDFFNHGISLDDEND